MTDTPSAPTSEFIAQTHLALLLIDPETEEIVSSSRMARQLIGLPGGSERSIGLGLLEPHPPELFALARTAPSRGVLVSKQNDRRLEASAGPYGSGHIVVHLSGVETLARITELNNQYLSARQDVARLQGLEAELGRRIRDLESIASVLSHDLRAPARRTAQWAELALATVGSGDVAELNNMLERTRRSANSIESMVQALTRMLVSTRSVEMSDVDLDEVLAEAREVVWEPSAPVGGSLCVDRLPTVFGSRALLSTVFQNLISNAVKHAGTDVPLRVDVTLESRDGEVSILFADNGPGIPADLHEQAFRPFWTRNGRHDESSGMGLATVRSAMEAMGGTVTIDASYDRGTRFVLRLRSGGHRR